MKKILIFIFVLFLFIPWVFCQDNDGEKLDVLYLDLNQAVKIAYDNNKVIQEQQEQVDTAKADIMLARSRLIPKLNLDASYKHNNTVMPTSTANINAKKDYGIYAGYRNDNQMGLSIKDSVYTGGRNMSLLKQSKIKFTIQEETLRAQKLQVEYELKRLYYGLLLAYEVERIEKNLVDQANAHYDDVKSKFEQGTASQFDVLQSKVQVSKVIPGLVRARNDISLITEELKKLLGISFDKVIIIKERLGYSPIEIQEIDFLQYAYVHNPQMILNAFGVDVSKLNINVARSEGLPQLDANLNYIYRSSNWNNMFNSRHNNWSGGVALTVPIFDAFSTKAKVDAAKAQYKKSILEEKDFKDQINVDVRKACLDLKESQTIILSQEDAISEAAEALRLANVKYDNGVGTNLDVLDSQVSLSEVEKNLVGGKYDYLMAKAYLDDTLGISVFKEEDIK